MINIVAGLLLCYGFGKIFYLIGNSNKKFKYYLGGGTTVAILLPSFLIYLDFIPTMVVDNIQIFVDETHFFFIYIALITITSVLVINRDFLRKMFRPFLLACFSVIILSTILTFIIGSIIPIPLETLFVNFFFPIIGSGTSEGVIPISEIYADIYGVSPSVYVEMAMPVVIIANFIVVFIATFLNSLAKKFPKHSNDNIFYHLENSDPLPNSKCENLSTNDWVYTSGKIITIILLGLLLNYFVPNIGIVVLHKFLYLVLLAYVANVYMKKRGNELFVLQKMLKWIVSYLTPIMITSVGFLLMDFEVFIEVLTIENLLLMTLVIFIVIFSALIVAKLFNIYLIEGVVLLALCLCNRGGVGDIMTLEAYDKIHLIPFAQLITRIGGVIIIALSSIMFSILFNVL